MIPLTVAEIAAATGGEPSPGTDPRTPVPGPVVIDSREAAPGALFVAFAGAHLDAVRFAPAARAAGAAAVLAARDPGPHGVVVTDLLAAVGALAAEVRSRLTDLTAIGVTGSAGKTGTKDLIAHLLAGLGPTVAPPGSFNNELGAPLTVLRCDPDTRYLVSEMGARGRGHIGYLCRIARPRIGAVLNVGTAHLGEFGDRAGIAAAKGELVESLPADGVAVLNGDDELVAAMAARTAARVVTFGTGPRAQVRAREVTLDALARPRFVLDTPAGTAPVTLRLHGRHQVANALAAAAVAVELGLDVATVAQRLGTAEPASRWRMELTERPDGVLVLNDAYNANPDAMRAALAALATIGHPEAGTPRRTWAVLGEMVELGEQSEAGHREVGREALSAGVDRLVAVGPVAAAMAREAVAAGADPRHFRAVADQDAAVELLAAELRPGDAVLVKASRAAGLDALAARLLRPAEAAGPPDHGPAHAAAGVGGAA